MLDRPRPLSPFLHYRWQYTNTLSILHRLSGIVLSGAFVLFVCWVSAIGRGPAAYAHVSAVLAQPLFKVLLALAVLAFAYHLCNGVRHLFWDAGLGLERREARRSARMVALATLFMVAVVSALVLLKAGRAP
jgi:succinate dehydrogenase / fumarate reductase cytochrome b subunit